MQYGSRRLQLNLVLITALAGLYSHAQAAPVIQSTSGSIAQNSTVTITGSGFGTKATAAPKVWDTVDNQTSYVGSLTGSLTGILGSLVGQTVPVGASYVYQINSFNDPNSLKFGQSNLRNSYQKMNYRTSNYRGYLQYPNSMGGQTPPASQTEVYISFWFRPDASIDGSGHSSKFIRVWDDSDGVGSRISWTQMHMTVVNSQGYESTAWGDWGGRTGQWNRLEMFVSGPKRLVRTWVNGKQLHNVTDFQKDPSFSNVGLTMSRVGWDPGGTTYAPVNSSFGDIFIDVTQARVELCNQSTWAQCSAREAQPATSWASGQIAFKLQLGSLITTQPIYAYVVDADGNVNANGVQLNSTSVAPKPPSDISVQ